MFYPKPIKVVVIFMRYENEKELLLLRSNPFTWF